MAKDILVIPDTHLRPGAGCERMTWLGKMIVDRKPDVVVHIGDLFDMPSLCSHDKGKGIFWSRNYKKDLDAGHVGMDALHSQLRKGKYNGDLRFLLGNHEQRIDRAIAEDPRLEGTIGYGDFKMAERGWNVTDFNDIVEIEGVHFSHYFTTGVMGKPISGDNAAMSLLQKQHVSCVQGHSHLYGYAERVRGDGKRILGLIAGCFLEPGQREGYAGQSQRMWRNGVSVLHGASKGVYDLEFVSVERLKETYA